MLICDDCKLPHDEKTHPVRHRTLTLDAQPRTEQVKVWRFDLCEPCVKKLLESLAKLGPPAP